MRRAVALAAVLVGGPRGPRRSAGAVTVSFWHMNETSGSTMVDSVDGANGRLRNVDIGVAGALRPRLPLQRLELGRDRAAHAGAQRPVAHDVHGRRPGALPRPAQDGRRLRPRPQGALRHGRRPLEDGDLQQRQGLLPVPRVVGDGDHQRRAAAGRQPLAPDQLRQADRAASPSSSTGGATSGASGSARSATARPWPSAPRPPAATGTAA